jgi:hypothetical protein
VRSLMQVVADVLAGAPSRAVHASSVGDRVAVRIAGDGRRGDRWARVPEIGDVRGDALLLAVPWESLSREA